MTSKTQQPIGILGGTFDPVHNGHIQLAQAILKKLPLEKILFIPCYQPVHRGKPIATPQQRLNMLRLVTDTEPKFAISEAEINRQGPSYMIDTLAELKKLYPYNPLCLTLGMDAFAKLDTWHQWQQLLDGPA